MYIIKYQEALNMAENSKYGTYTHIKNQSGKTDNKCNPSYLPLILRTQDLT